MKQVFKIGYYDDSASPGGTTRYLLEILRCLDRSRFHPVFFATDPSRAWYSVLRDLDVEIVSTRSAPAVPVTPPTEKLVVDQSAPKATGSGLARFLPASVRWHLGTQRETQKLVPLFQKASVDLLHSNHAGAEVAPIAARQAGVPRILATWHVDSTYDLNHEREGLRYRLLEKRCMAALDHVVAVSQATRDNWVQRCGLSTDYQKRISVIYNGVDVENIYPKQTKQDARAKLGLPVEGVLIGSLGRLDQAKGYEYLIRALPELLKECPDALVAIAGKGPLETELKELAKALNVDSRIRFLGFLSDINTFLESLDIYVQPSLCEAHPFGTLEAGSMGLPIVASAVGGIPETIVADETGFLFPSKDSAALAKHLKQLVQNEELRLKMAKAGRNRIQEHFRTDLMVSQTTALYGKILKVEP
ncbi:MAG: glycosyltransferase family 4 protein [Armatimonas sp.]